MFKILSYITLVLFPLLSFSAEFERISHTPKNHQAFSIGGSSLPSSANSVLSVRGSSFSQKSEHLQTGPIRSLTAPKHIRYHQLINDIPVWSAELIVHNESELLLTGKILKNINLDKITPIQYSETEIYDHGILFINKKYSQALPLTIQKKATQAYIYKKDDGSLVNALLLDLFINGENLIARPQIMISAEDLSILKFWDNLQHIEAKGTGPGGNEKVGRYQYGADFPNFLVRETNGTCTMENSNVKAVDLQHSSNPHKIEAFSYPCSTSTKFENTYKEINGAYSPINDAFYFGNITFDMYQQWYSIKPIPKKLSMKVHFGKDIDNAFWTGDSMLFGDGKTDFYPLVDINVSAHEVSHGFTQFNSDLIYQDQSGGINESFSDIAGEAAEFFMNKKVDWLVGGAISKDKDALRYFIDPTRDNSSIKHLSDYKNGLNVHFSSGIYNHAFYLLATTTDWDVRKAFDIFVHANKNYWVKDETFINGVCGLISSAKDLKYNTLDVAVAFNDVGIICPTFNLDTDNDLITDIWEISHGFNYQSSLDAQEDFDKDGLTNLQEFQKGLKPKFNDSDWDGILDAAEISLTIDPVKKDSDEDGMPDGFEVKYGLSPKVDDSADDLDSDGLSNLIEFQYDLNPNKHDQLIPYIYSKYKFSQPLSSHWKPVGNYSWNITKHEKELVLSTEDIADEQSAQIDVTSRVRKGDKLSFDLKTSSEEGFDFFILQINGAKVYELSGINDWTKVTHEYQQSGNITVSFIYKKDEVFSESEDRVYINNILGLRLNQKDDDKNGIADYWQFFYKVTDPTLDPDKDGLNNLDEFLASTSPLLADSDHDGLNDESEVNQYKTDPLSTDTDNDGIADKIELDHNLDPLNKEDALLDSDSDGYNNVTEAKFEGDILDSKIIANPLLYMNDDFSIPENTFKWYTEKQSALPNHKQYGTWLITKGEFKPQAIDNDMVAIATFKTLFEKGDLTFDLLMDTEENNDELIIYIDGKVIERFSGIINKKVQLTIPTGIHEVNFVYKKNLNRSSIKDSLAIDNLNFIALGDFDGDTLSNAKELELGTNLRSIDTDGDSHNDNSDDFPKDAKEWLDFDKDGHGDNSDIFPKDAKEWLDTDKDGHGDNSDIFPLDAKEWLDTDKDGHGDNSDHHPTNPNKWKKDKKKDAISLGAMNLIWLVLFMVLLTNRRNLNKIT